MYFSFPILKYIYIGKQFIEISCINFIFDKNLSKFLGEDQILKQTLFSQENDPIKTEDKCCLLFNGMPSFFLGYSNWPF